MEHNDEPPASDARAAEPDDLLLRVLRRHWGYDSFRPGQREIIRALLNRQDALVLMATSLLQQQAGLSAASPGVGPLLVAFLDQFSSLPQTPDALHAVVVDSASRLQVRGLGPLAPLAPLPGPKPHTRR